MEQGMLNYKINPNNKVQTLQIKHYNNIFKGGWIHSSKTLTCCVVMAPQQAVEAFPAIYPWQLGKSQNVSSFWNTQTTFQPCHIQSHLDHISPPFSHCFVSVDMFRFIGLKIRRKRKRLFQLMQPMTSFLFCQFLAFLVIQVFQTL